MLGRVRSLEGGVAPPRAPRLPADSLLRQEAGGRDHCKAAMRELLLLHQTELVGVLRLEVERVEGQVARVVALAQRRRGLVGRGVDLGPAPGDADLLGRADASQHGAPQPDGKPRDLVDGSAAVAGEERVELLLHEETDRRKHGHAAVSKLGLAQAVDLQLRLARHEASRVELAEDVVTAGQTVRELGLRGRLHLRRDLRGAHGRAGEGGRLDGDDGEHGGCVLAQSVCREC
mmetsp:Transcript_81134/g.196946  ORF Transcript_81134/g.196946 Transcript_81134/m.196946 type:complete len:232 (+) Transcript_81134:112-807(+)